MRKASLATLSLTVFLDLLGFGLVVPFLPGVARDLGASDLVAALLGASFSFMQFLFIPLWARLSDRVGRRPVLLWSIAASAAGMAMLGFASGLAGLFVARLFSGAATANIAVAQAYVADSTPPHERSRGMGLIGAAFGVGFIFGPFIGGVLGGYEIMGRHGVLAAFTAAGFSVLNLALTLVFLPESLPRERRGQIADARRHPFDFTALRAAWRLPGVGRAASVGFLVVFWFAGLEQTFRLFTMDAFAMSMAGTGQVFAVVGVVAIVVQGGLIHPLTRRFGERRLVRAATLVLAAGFALIALSPSLRVLGVAGLFAASAVVALGNGLHTPSLSSYVSRQAGAASVGLALGVLQSLGALGRVLGPVVGGLAYEFGGMRGPYALGAAGLVVAALIAARLPDFAPPAA